MRSLLFLTILALCSQAFANVEVSLSQPNENETIGKRLPDVSFLNEDNQKVKLSSSEEKAFLFVPFYTHCKSTCPLNISHLKDVLKNFSNNDYRVVLFSFNPDDTFQDLKDFRKALQVPKEWSIFKASAGDTNSILRTIDFRYMTEGVDFVHSNTIVVLSPTLGIVKFIQGLGYTPRSIDNSIKEAKRLTHSAERTSLIVLALLLALFVLTQVRGSRFDKMSRVLHGESQKEGHG